MLRTCVWVRHPSEYSVPAAKTREHILNIFLRLWYITCHHTFIIILLLLSSYFYFYHHTFTFIIILLNRLSTSLTITILKLHLETFIYMIPKLYNTLNYDDGDPQTTQYSPPNIQLILIRMLFKILHFLTKM